MSNRDIEGMFHVTNTLFTIPLFKRLEDHYVIKWTIILQGCIIQMLASVAKTTFIKDTFVF